MDVMVFGIAGMISGFFVGSVYVSGNIILSLLLLYIPAWILKIHLSAIDITIIVGCQAVVAAVVVLPFRHRVLHWDLLKSVLIPASVSSLVGSLWLKWIPPSVILALLAVVTAGAVLLSLWNPVGSRPPNSTHTHCVLGATGFLVGFFGGTLGLGGGFLLVPTLRALGLPLRDAISNALVAGGFIALIGLMAKLPYHAVSPLLILVVGLTSVLGTGLGTAMSRRIPTTWLRYLVLGGMSVTALNIWLKLLF